eukprot:gene11485-biopygen6370
MLTRPEGGARTIREKHGAVPPSRLGGRHTPALGRLHGAMSSSCISLFNMIQDAIRIDRPAIVAPPFLHLFCPRRQWSCCRARGAPAQHATAAAGRRACFLTGGNGTPASGPCPARVRSIEFYFAARVVRSASAAVSPTEEEAAGARRIRAPFPPSIHPPQQLVERCVRGAAADAPATARVEAAPARAWREPAAVSAPHQALALMCDSFPRNCSWVRTQMKMRRWTKHV